MNICFFIYNKISRILKDSFYAIYNRIYFKFAGVHYGRGLKVIGKVYILGKGRMSIGDNFTFNSGGCYNPISRNIKGAFYLVDKNSKIEIGNNVGISSSCLWAHNKIIIGNNVNIGGDCLIMDNDAHPHDYLQRRSEFEKRTDRIQFSKIIPSAPIEIGDDVWIGARCQILKGVHIGCRSIIAAGSVVTKDVPEDVVAGGNPCKIIRQLQ